MSVDAGSGTQQGQQLSLGTAAARNLATTTKSVPQMQGITSRWLLRVLPWVQTEGGVYRVNRRLTYTVGDGRIEFVKTGSRVQVIPRELGELAVLRGFEDMEVLTALAGRFAQRDFEAGEVLAEEGTPADHIHLLAHGKVQKTGSGAYGEPTRLGTLGDGDHFGEQSLLDADATWECTLKAITAGTLLTLPRREFASLMASTPALREHVEAFAALPGKRQNDRGEADIAVASGHSGEPDLPGTFVDYELDPREYELSVAQTVLRVHSRVADLYNKPMNQTEQQLRLTIEALRERQEHELINNRDFGLLHNADYDQRIQAHSGPPTPDDLDELLSRRRGSRFFFAHPRTIAAIGREMNARGIYPDHVDLFGNHVPAWRGVPILPCNKIPVTKERTSSVIVVRTGEEDQGVIGLHHTGLPDEYEPGLSVRFMGIDDKAIISYLVTTYYSAAVLVPDALGVLENVEISRGRD
ncbi:cyclic nucleotide-binding domain-containing protein [Streptomyces sp. TRM43335]|uniref:Cyclic nucleotide-binding domain-containing protein n=1 Tax=Streptomyces taklimakanensis TaxID=2569853 RepID=A0A6G2B6C5_9ACTN|nr:family 2B encapsulin nanocompartment shell protein [Streptomyces taklimakanensis]MTE17825.1 cyclic nucleotide-binding domain-containing protein [Streptomyces taklimakanensis]